MQIFIDSKQLAASKDLANLFVQNNNFIPSGKVEAGSAEEQPARNSLSDGNNKVVEQNPTAFITNYFYHNALKPTCQIKY